MVSLLSNDDLAVRLGQLYNRVLELRTNADYVLNQPQMEKLIKVLSFFIEVADDEFDEVLEPEVIPSHQHGGVTANFIVFSIRGDDIAKFCDAISGCSALSIDVVEEEKVCISVTVPNVFVHR